MLGNGGKLTKQLLRQINAQRIGGGTRHAAAGAAVAEAPKKIEVFIDDKKVLVEPGMTILQVRAIMSAAQNFGVYFQQNSKQWRLDP